ncbi:MAG: hypothetical protein AAGC90_10240 [Curtobacterium sp.]|jgi:hypothetical protein|uniref:hypothetical protein n=1 Tax=unclassified Curtobacterium TaxID=257496 RepID=UPI0007D73177|nr:hypothetical protein [Curtobacterium sp. 9128]SBN62474.1 hypothetical protein GA0004736_1376 [Curtobacterium sp. 9128]
MQPTPKADVTAALIALTGQGEHPIVVSAEGDRITGTWSTNLSGQPTGDGGVTLLGNATWNWHVTLLDEGVYKASMSSRNWPDGGGYFSFRSSWVAAPMKRVLADHGWQRRKNPFVRAWATLTGRR